MARSIGISGSAEVVDILGVFCGIFIYFERDWEFGEWGKRPFWVV